MKKKRRNFGMMMKNKMGMGPASAPRPINNPILLLNTYPALSETSVVDQDTTLLSIKGSGIISRHFQALQAQFTIVVNIAIYAPNAQLDPMAVFDESPSTSDGTPGQTRIYNKAFQFGFGKNDNAYQHAMFYINNVPPVDGTLNITIKHPLCKRRIVTVDQFANINARNPLDQQTSQQSGQQGVIQITSGLTQETSQPFELVYGSVAIGRNFNQYSEPQGFIPIQSVGSNIDTFDATLKTYYKLSAQQNQFGLSALVSGPAPNNFVWSAAVQTFTAAQL